jgi:hypothetical protein
MKQICSNDSCWLATSIKEYHSNTKEFLNWLRQFFLLTLQNGRVIIMIMDYNSVYIGERIAQAIEAEDHIILYLPHSPNFNSIELTFSIFKA